MLSFWQFFDSQMAIFRRVRPTVTTGVSGLAQKWVRLPPNMTNRGFFSDKISVHFGPASQNLQKPDLKKKSELVPFGANLNHFGVKPDTPESAVQELSRLPRTAVVWLYNSCMKGTIVGQKSSQNYSQFSKSVHPQVPLKKSFLELLLGKCFKALRKGCFFFLFSPCIGKHGGYK